jgi:hypothetical protein
MGNSTVLATLCRGFWSGTVVGGTASRSLRQLASRHGFSESLCSMKSCPIILALTILGCGNVHHGQSMTRESEASSSVLSDSTPGRNVTEWSTDRSCDTQNQPGPWVCYYFWDRRVQLTHYSIRSPGDGYCLRSSVLVWPIAGYGPWTEWDSQRTNYSLNGSFRVTVVPVTSIAPVRSVWLRQTRSNHRDSHHLTLAGLERFGSISE